jgi:hypothetical protein
MGMVICKKHGRTGVRIDVLDEICKKILTDKPIDQEMLSFIHVEYFDNKELLFDTNYIVTKRFKEERNLEDYYKISTDKEQELLNRKLGNSIGAICGKCFDEYLERYNLSIARQGDTQGIGVTSHLHL